MKIGYARISTTDQNLDLQIDALKQAGCERIYCDTITGSSTHRPEFDKMLEALRPGDVLTVWKLDRIGRSLKHLIEISHHLDQQGVDLHIITQGIDTTTPAGKMLFQIMGSVAEYEKALIQERVQAGLKSARERGRVGGRPTSLNHEQKKQIFAMHQAKTSSVSAIAKTFGVSRPTIYKVIKAEEERRSNLKAVI